MHEPPLGMPRLRPGIGEQQHKPLQRCRRHGAQQRASIIGPDTQVIRQLRGQRIGALRNKPGEKGRNPVLEHLAGDQPSARMRRDLRQRMLAAAETDFQPQPRRRRAKRPERVRRIAHGQTGQSLFEQLTLPRPQRMPARPAIQAVGLRLERRGQRSSVSG